MRSNRTAAAGNERTRGTTGGHHRARTALAQRMPAAEAARIYLERTNASVETVNRAAEIRILAERQMGAFLAKMPKATGMRMAGGGESPVVTEGNRRETSTLASIGITKKQSASAQKLAKIPEPEFHGQIEAIKANGEKLTPAAVLRGPEPKPVNDIVARAAAAVRRARAVPAGDLRPSRVMAWVCGVALCIVLESGGVA